MTQENKLKAPWPYFGGKSRVANMVWSKLGSVKHYIEPFCGSAAVLLARPDFDHHKHVETINDYDGMIANCWRSLQFAPDEVARWCDWPVTHVDLSARKIELNKRQEELRSKLVSESEYYDAKLAGYYIWAACCWIGSGLVSIGQIPHISDAGKGVHSIGKRPHISTAGKGVHSIGKRPHISTAGKGVQDPYNTGIFEWFRKLSERLRYVRVVCGDWTRICGGNWQDKIGVCGIFFDPPYSAAERDNKLYTNDSMTIAQDVNVWCLERGGSTSYRIVLAGYFDEHKNLLEHGWSYFLWKAQGGYANISKAKTQGKLNRHKETLFFSPHCVGGDDFDFSGKNSGK